MGRYTIKSAFKFPAKEDDDIEKYGETWWCDIEEHAFPVMFNARKDTVVNPTDRVNFEEELVKKTGENSRNPGSEYRRLKKITIESGTPKPVNTKKDDVVIEDIPEQEEISLSDIPF